MRKATARISLVLVLALLLQLMAGPLGYVISANAAETNLEKKVLYSENFDKYADATGTKIGTDATTAGWKVTQGADYGTFTLANGKMNLSGKSGNYTVAQLFEVEGQDPTTWSNYTVEFDMGQNNGFGNWFGVAYNMTDYDNHQKVGLYGTDKYFLNGRSTCDHKDKDGWVNNSGDNHKSNTVGLTWDAAKTYRVKVETSNMDGETNGTAKLSVAEYNGTTLGTYKEVITVNTIDLHTYKGTIGVVLRNGTVDGWIDNIEVYQMVEKTEEPDDGLNLPEGMVLYFQDDFSSYAEGTVIGTTAVGPWKQADGNETATVTGGALKLTGSESGYSHWFVTVAEDKEKKIPASSEWTNYTMEFDITNNNTSVWAGFVYNFSEPAMHHKVGLYGTFNYFINARHDAYASTNNDYQFFHDNGSNQQSVANTSAKDAAAAAGITKWENGVTYRVKLVTSGFDGTNNGTGTLYIAKYTNGTLGDWVEVITVNNLRGLINKGTVGVMNSANAGTNVVFDNILVYGPALTEDSGETDPTDPTTPDPEPPAVIEPTRTAIEVLYEEDFDDIADGTALTAITYADGAKWAMKTTNGTYTVKNKALNLVNGASDSYSYAILNKKGAEGWSNYTVEYDITYTSSTYVGMLFNAVDETHHLKVGLYSTNSYFINGYTDGDPCAHGTNNWLHNSGVNQQATSAYSAWGQNSWRIKLVTSGNNGTTDGAATLYIAPITNGVVGEYKLITDKAILHACMEQGTIGLMTSYGAANATIDNIKVYKEKEIWYEEDFNEFDGDKAVAQALGAEGSEWGNAQPEAHNLTVKLDDGMMNVTGGAGHAYFELLADGADKWQNYTVEADFRYNADPSAYWGLVYNGVDQHNHQKAGVYQGSQFYLNGRYNGSWVNDVKTGDNYNHGASDVLGFTSGEWMRMKVETYNQTGTAEGSTRFWIAYYDKDGKLGDWQFVADVHNIDKNTFKGTIGFYCNGGGRDVDIDNIVVYATELDPLPPEKEPVGQIDGVSNIYDVTPTTGITNPPVVGQIVTNALPTFTDARTPALLFVNIDEDLNILANNDETVLATMDEFIAAYKATIIPAFIVSSEAEAEALAEFVKATGLLDAYVLAKSGELTTSTVKAIADSETGVIEGKDITTATCPGAGWVAAATTAYGIKRTTTTNLRGGLIMSAELLTVDLNGDGKVDYDDLAVICHMAASDTGVTTIIFDGKLTVDQMTYFNNHSIAVWSTAMDASDVWSGIAAGVHGIAVEQAATAYDVYESIPNTVITQSGRPMPITHRGAHMNYGRETEKVTGLDGVEFTYYGECENSAAAFMASWNYFGVMGSECDPDDSAACSGDDATCTHTLVEGAGACDHVNCKLCQRNIYLEHDVNLTTTTNINSLKTSTEKIKGSELTYAEVFDKGNAPGAYTMYELKLLTLTGKGNNKLTGTKQLITMEEALEAAENLANGNYVYYAHIHAGTIIEDIFDQLMKEHPEYIDNVVIFKDASRIESSFNWSTLDTPVPITFADNGVLSGTFNGKTIVKAVEDAITLMNRHNGHFLGYHYQSHTDSNDDFYYAIAARGVVSYHSVTTGQNVANYHIMNNGAIGCLIEQPRLVDDWHYFVETPTEAITVAAGAKAEVTAKVRTIVGDVYDVDNLHDVPVGIQTVSGPEFYYSEKLGGYTADEAGTATVVLFYEATADNATYRVYSEPVEITVEIGVTGVELSKSALELTVGQETGLSAVVTPVDAENKAVTWTSSDETVATVNSNGIVVAKGAGEAIITVTTVENGYTDTCVVTVSGAVTDEDALAVIEKIDAIGEVTAESDAAIDAAREAYEALSAEDKALVSNYSDLLDAEAAYAEALKDAATTAEEQKAAAEAAVEAANNAVEAAKDKLDQAAADKAEAEEALKKAQEDKSLTDEQKAEAVAKYEAAVEVLEEAESALADAEAKKADADADLAKAEEAIKSAEENAALATAKYDALNKLNEMADEISAKASPESKGNVVHAKYSLIAQIGEAGSIEAVNAIMAQAEKTLTEAAEFEPVSFEDVVKGSYYEEAVNAMAESGLIKGVSEDTFGVGQNVTRGQLVTILYRAAGSPSVEGIENPFSDVIEGAYYYEAVLWAFNSEVVTGLDASHFAPNANISREQMATILFRMDGAVKVEEDHLGDFADADKVANYAVEGMNWAVANGLIKGASEDTLAAGSTATREQAAVILYRYFESAVG